MTQIPTTVPSNPSEKIRFNWVEVFRGFAILEVVLHHVSGRFMREFEQFSPPWVLLAKLNQTLHFAVPGFLFLTTIVLGTSLIRDFNIRKYARNRVVKVLWPYLLWSAIYLFWRWAGYGNQISGKSLILALFWGKANFHLYFLAVSLQLTVLLPLLTPVLRARPKLWMVLLGGTALTVMVYWSNRLWLHFPYVGTVVLWYIPSVALGIWIAGNAAHVDKIVKKAWPWALISVGLSASYFLPIAMNVLYKVPVKTAHYQFGNWAYTASMTILLLCIAVYTAKTQWGQKIRFLGTFSLQIYLIHPLIINILDFLPNRIGVIPVGLRFFVYVGLCIAIPLTFALALKKLKVSEWVFGR